MDGSTQVIFDLAIGISSFLFAFLLYAIWGRLGRLEKADGLMAKELSQLHILVAGEYVKRVEIEPKLDAIYGELREIRKEVSRRRDVHRAD